MTILWVAEIGTSHKGNKALAYELIRQAAHAGATVAKFQFGWTMETQIANTSGFKPERYVDDWAADLKNWCQSFRIKFMASIWSLEGLETAKRIGLTTFKVAYQKRDDVELMQAIQDTGRMTYVSGGDWSKTTIPIWCKSAYPAYPADLRDMPPLFGGRWFGYSDHAHGIAACLLAVARGATYIEKHFCLDKTDLTTRDTAFAADPAEFRQMVTIGNELEGLVNASPVFSPA